ncbi:transposase family protein [Frankia sp. Cas3]|uniref:helix-turn-helix domain-containing protein n=1 Tax=Frankia sp. Cas3 TaxID=3073926 RepID=UPI002AD502A1|nr:transposase family protein [Frankia sp. Cas3]
MRNNSTTGLSADEIREIICRIEDVIEVRLPSGRPPALGLFRQVDMLLVLLRQNLSQTTVADLFEVSQPTVFRTYRRLMPLLDQVLCLHQPAFTDVLANRDTLVDGTDIPTGNRTGAAENYSGKRRRQGLNVQVAAATDDTVLAVSDPVAGGRCPT